MTTPVCENPILYTLAPQAPMLQCEEPAPHSNPEPSDRYVAPPITVKPLEYQQAGIDFGLVAAISALVWLAGCIIEKLKKEKKCAGDCHSQAEEDSFRNPKRVGETDKDQARKDRIKEFHDAHVPIVKKAAEAKIMDVTAEEVCQVCHTPPKPGEVWTTNGHIIESGGGYLEGRSEVVLSSGLLAVSGEEQARYEPQQEESIGRCQVACHPGAVLLSVDGDEKVEVRCEACHEVEALPPSHEAHLAECLICDSCHSLSFRGIHFGNGSVVAFSGGAVLSGYTPRFDGQTCSETYCHGSVAGAQNPNPTWGSSLEGDAGGANRCLACHDPHDDPNNIETEGRCQICHPIIGEDGTIQDKAGHINGGVIAKQECGDCHGTEEDPSSLPGNHLKHLVSSMMNPKIICTDCHNPLPESVLKSGHVVDSEEDIHFSPRVLDLSEDEPVYMKGIRTCVDIGCHDPRGPEPGYNPIWGAETPAGNECRVCHAPHEDPADRPRTQNQCSACHSQTAGSGETIREGTTTHIDNRVEGVQCGDCHQVTVPPAAGNPPLETSVHQKHLGRDRFLSPPPDCDDCHHPKPTGIFSPDHFDGEADVRFGPRGKSRTGSAYYDYETQTCVDVGCHNGTSVRSESGEGEEIRCNTCHPDKGPEHHFGLDCLTCHELDVEDHISRSMESE